MQDFAPDAIKLLVFLLPGFITLRVLAHMLDVKKEEYEYYVVEALIHSMLIYMFAGFFCKTLDLTSSKHIFSLVLISVIWGFIVGFIRKKEWLSCLFRSKKSTLSTHDKIFYANAGRCFFGKWSVVGLKDDKEILGIIHSFDTDSHEMLIENARWIINGKLPKMSDKAWIYLPPNDDIRFIRSIENTN